MWMFPDFKLRWLVEETKLNLPCELNFMKEGLNAEKTGRLLNYLSWLHVPDYSLCNNKLSFIQPSFCYSADTQSILGF